MSATLITAAGSGAGLSLPAMSQAEAAALEVPGLAMRFSASDRDPTARALTYRDGVSGRALRSAGAAAHGDVAGRPALRCNASATGMLVGEGLIPPASYTIYALVTPNANANWHTIFAHMDRAAGSLWMFADASRLIHLAHGSTGSYEIYSAGAYTSGQTYLVVAAYDAASGQAAVGVNTLSLTAGPMVPHNGASGIGIGGTRQSGSGTHVMSGWIEEVWVFTGSHAQAGSEADLAAVASYLADLGGVALT